MTRVAYFDPDRIDHGFIRINFWFGIVGYFLDGLFAQHASTIAAPGCRCIDTLVLHQVLSWIIERDGNWGVLALALIQTQLAGDRFRAPLCLEVVINLAVMPVVYKNLNRIVLMWNRLLQCWQSRQFLLLIQEIEVSSWTPPHLCKPLSGYIFSSWFSV